MRNQILVVMTNVGRMVGLGLVANNIKRCKGVLYE
jgi:hypothetical protein